MLPGDKQLDILQNHLRMISVQTRRSNQATQYILTEDENGDCSRSFKTFLTCVEHSNKGFATQWGDDFGQQSKENMVGGVYGPQMDYYEEKRAGEESASLVRECG